MLKHAITLLVILVPAGCDQVSDEPQAGPSASAPSPAVATGSGPADEGRGFYAGKNLTYIVGTRAGGGFDAYARLIGRYMEDYLGADNVTIRNVPGAGHIVATNTLWESRPDGLTIGTFSRGLIYNQLIGLPSLRFDLGGFEWIGKAASITRAIVAGAGCPIQNLHDLIEARAPVRFSSAGIGSASYVDTLLLAEALGFRVNLIPGFDGTEGEMAMLRGEICMQVANVSALREFVEAGHGAYILTIGGRLDGVPLARDIVRSERGRRIIALIDAVAQLGRPTAAPPGTPPARVRALRDAYRAALEHPQLLARAEKMGLPIVPAYGGEVRRVFQTALEQDADVVEFIRNALDTDQSAGR